MKHNNKNKIDIFARNIIFVFFLLSMNWVGISSVGSTVARFSDTEDSVDNIFNAALFDFSITNSKIEDFLGVTLGEDISFSSAVIAEIGSLPIQYEIEVEKTGGSDAFCDTIDLEALHVSTDYDSSLMSFIAGPTSFLGTWAFEISRPFTSSNIAHGEECFVDVVFLGWLDSFLFEESGFWDEERIELHLTSRMIVLNEFLPRPDGEAYGFDFGDDSSDMPKGEWVEIYNNSDYDFDVSGWYIWDDSGSETNKIEITDLNTMPSSTVVSAHDWLVVYMNKAVLNNTGDTVKLYDSSDTLIDSYTYDGSDYCELEPTPGDENSSSASGDCDTVPSNKSYARIPDGIGTWVDPIPTPGRSNTEDEEEGRKALNEISDQLGFLNEDVSSGSEGGTEAPEQVEIESIESPDNIQIEDKNNSEPAGEELVSEEEPVTEEELEEKSVEEETLLIDEISDENISEETEETNPTADETEEETVIEEEQVSEKDIEDEVVDEIIEDEEPIEETIVEEINEEVIKEEPAGEIVEETSEEDEELNNENGD